MCKEFKTASEVIKIICKLRGWTYPKLASEAGMKAATNVTGILNRGVSMKVNTLVALAEAMGCEVVIRDKFDSKREWVIKE